MTPPTTQSAPAWRSLTLREAAGEEHAVTLDLDSTLWDLCAAVAPVIRERFGVAHLSEADIHARVTGAWDGIVTLLGDRVAEAFAEVFGYEPMSRHGLFAGAAEAVGRLRADGVRIVVMTHRPLWCLEDVARFLADHGLEADEIHCGHMDKVSESIARGIQVLVDDKPDTIEAAHAAGLSPLSLVYPYNAPVMERLGIAPARSWVELERQIIAALAEVAPR